MLSQRFCHVFSPLFLRERRCHLLNKNLDPTSRRNWQLRNRDLFMWSLRADNSCLQPNPGVRFSYQVVSVIKAECVLSIFVMMNEKCKTDLMKLRSLLPRLYIAHLKALRDNVPFGLCMKTHILTDFHLLSFRIFGSPRLNFETFMWQLGLISLYK
jgi:hypothetical protein